MLNINSNVFISRRNDEKGIFLFYILLTFVLTFFHSPETLKVNLFLEQILKSGLKRVLSIWYCVFRNLHKVEKFENLQ